MTPTAKPTLADAIREAIDESDNYPDFVPRILDNLRAALPKAEAADALAEALQEVADCNLGDVLHYYNSRGDSAPAGIFYVQELARAALRRYREQS